MKETIRSIRYKLYACQTLAPMKAILRVVDQTATSIAPSSRDIEDMITLAQGARTLATLNDIVNNELEKLEELIKEEEAKKAAKEDKEPF